MKQVWFKYFLLAWGIVASLATNLADHDEQSRWQACLEDQDCAQEPKPQRCLTSYKICVECLDQDDCLAGESCKDHRCQALCNNASDCPQYQLCIDGLCRFCERDSDCRDIEQYCYIGPENARCLPLCRNTLDCTASFYEPGLVCRGGHCQSSECQSNNDCLLDQETCNLQTHLCWSVAQPQ